MIRGWVNINDTYHFVLKDKTLLCDAHTKYKGLKRDLIERNPTEDNYLKSRGNVCAKCRESWAQREMIEMTREDGISEDALPLGMIDPIKASKQNPMSHGKPVTLNNSKVSTKGNTPRKKVIRSAVKMVSHMNPDLIPGAQPFEPVVDNHKEIQSLASQLLSMTDNEHTKLPDFVNKFITDPSLQSVWYSTQYQEVNFRLGHYHAYDYYDMMKTYGESFCNKLCALATVRDYIKSNTLSNVDHVKAYNVLRVLTEDNCDCLLEDANSALLKYVNKYYTEPYRYITDTHRVLQYDKVYHNKDLALLSGIVDRNKSHKPSVYKRLLPKFFK